MVAKVNIREFKRRRQELMAMMEEKSIAILPGNNLVVRNSDVEYQFRQSSDFYYLTGFNEPEAVIVIIPGREHGENILFCRERDPGEELWHGQITGPERAMQLFGIDDAFPISDIDDILPGLIEGRSKLYYPMGAQKDFDNQVIGWVNHISANKQSGAKPPGEFIQLDQYLHELRLFKSQAEINVMRKASEIIERAHKQLLEVVSPGMYEYELDAELQYVFIKNGAKAWSKIFLFNYSLRRFLRIYPLFFFY